MLLIIRPGAPKAPPTPVPPQMPPAPDAGDCGRRYLDCARPSLRGSFRVGAQARSGQGPRPNSTPVRAGDEQGKCKDTAVPIESESTGRSGRLQRVQLGRHRTAVRVLTAASSSPAAPPASASNTFSVSKLPCDARSGCPPTRAGWQIPSDAPRLAPAAGSPRLAACNQQNERHGRQQGQHRGAKALHPETQPAETRSHPYLRLTFGYCVATLFPTASISARGLGHADARL